MTRTVRVRESKHIRDGSSLTPSTAHDSKPISHHYNHRAEKANKGQPQRGRKLQFEDFEWYGHFACDNQFNEIPGKVEGRWQPKQLSKQDNANEDHEPSKHNNLVDTGYLHPRHHRRSRRNQEYRSS